MDNQNRKLELLGNAPIPKALLAMGIPTMIGMLINALYNLVDAYFVGGLGESQMAAISVVYPLGQVVVGLGLLFGNGAASYISRLLGQRNKDQANKVASTALYSSKNYSRLWWDCTEAEKRVSPYPHGNRTQYNSCPLSHFRENALQTHSYHSGYAKALYPPVKH